MDENSDYIQGLLSSSSSPSFLNDLLNRLQLSANVENEISQGINSVYGNGRLGYQFPINDDSLSLGLLGSGYKVTGNTPDGRINESNFGVNGIDANYQSGQSNYGVSYERNPMMGNIINLLYNRQF